MRYSQILLTMVMVTVLISLSLSPPVLAQPTASEVLAEMNWSDKDKQRIIAGEFVRGEVKTVSDRDLSLAMGFLVKTSPAHLAEQIVAGELLKSDPQIKDYGIISDRAAWKTLRHWNV